MDQNLMLRTLAANELILAAELLSKAMLANPVHIAVFGKGESRRQEYLQDFFMLLLPVISNRGYLYGVFLAKELQGVLGVMKPTACNLPFGLKSRLAFNIFRKFGGLVGIKTCFWLLIWHWHDYKTPHWHLGPLAVAASSQQRGIATMLLNKVITDADVADRPLWLETDKQLNVNIYLKFGFTIQKKIRVFGVDNWLMINAKK